VSQIDGYGISNLLILATDRPYELKYNDFEWPEPFKKILTVKDALKKGDLYETDCPDSQGQVRHFQFAYIGY
jgi:hypothetical protein